jgi:hypothetical protein
MQSRVLWTAMLSAGLLAACGGGGSSPEATAPVDNTASVSLSGTAAKGLMANADVAALPVNADGSVGATALATSTTDAVGHYSLSFTGTKDQPYVIRVSAKADGSSTHLDEVTGQAQALPAGFSMRSLFVPAVSGTLTTSASITPFSEMAVAAATRASGGITAANAAQAVSTVTQLLGFNPTSVTATSVAGAASTDEQKLAVLLTAVSQLANSSALGCATGSAGDKVQCVVSALAASTSTGSIKLETASAGNTTDVSAALVTAVSTVLANPALSGAITSSTLTTIVTNLGCSGSACDAAPTSTPPAPNVAATAITSAKLLFTELKSDWAALFSRGGANSIATGAANAEAFKFRQAMTGVQAPAEMVVKDLGALLMGVDLYHDYKAGRTSSDSRGRAPDNVAGNAPSYNAVGCALYQDSATQVLATAPANANFIGCRASYYVTVTSDVNGTVTTDWRHGFTMTPNADGSFGYATRARKRVTTCLNGSCTMNANLALQTNAYAGTLTPTLDDNSRITGFAVTGELAGAFASDKTTLANDHHSWSLSGTRVIAGFKQETASIAGAVSAFNADGSDAGVLTIKSGASTEIPVAANGAKPSTGNPATQGELAELSLDVVWTTPGAEFEGIFAATEPVWDKLQGTHIVKKVVLSGALRNIAAGATNEFLKGALTATAEGYENFDESQPTSANNFYSTTLAFVGTVTAPNRPVLELSFGTSMKTFESQASTMTLQYRTLVAGAPRMVIGVTGSRAANGDTSFQLSEATSNLSLSWTQDASRGDLMHGSTLKIGELDSATGLLTFTDNSFVSLDIGL